MHYALHVMQIPVMQITLRHGAGLNPQIAEKYKVATEKWKTLWTDSTFVGKKMVVI